MRCSRWLVGTLLLLGACGSAERPAVLDGGVAPTVTDHHARRVEGSVGQPLDALPLLGLFTLGDVPVVWADPFGLGGTLGGVLGVKPALRGDRRRRRLQR